MQPNPKLQPLAAVIGEWIVVGSHPMLPGRTLRGTVLFDWIESGAFLRWRMRMDDPEIPHGVAIFGTDDGTGEGAMIYFDVRGVSREYRWSFSDNVLRWWRDDRELSQRSALTILDSGDAMEWKGEMSRDGADWEPDLQLKYQRLGTP